MADKKILVSMKFESEQDPIPLGWFQGDIQNLQNLLDSGTVMLDPTYVQSEQGLTILEISLCPAPLRSKSNNDSHDLQAL